MDTKPKIIILISTYLSAIILANLAVAYFGPKASIISAFFLIGLDLVARDILHELWQGKMLWIKMGSLIILGGIISFLINKDTLMIAIASCIAFIAAGIVDTVIYHLLRKKSYLIKVNGSNSASSLIDSIIFPTIAFNAFMPLIILGQFVAKVIGGFFWSLVLKRVIKKG